MGFPRQEYWSGLPFPFPGDLPDPGNEAISPVSHALEGRFYTGEPPGKPHFTLIISLTPGVRTSISEFWRGHNHRT